MQTSKAIHYINGDAAEYTGHSEMLHGAVCYQVRIIEGHRTGEMAWTYHPPKVEVR